MKRYFYYTIIALAVFAALTGNAFATNDKNPCGNSGNNCNQGTPNAGSASTSAAQAGAVGVGVGVSNSRSSAVSRNRNTNVNANRAEGGRASSRAQGGSATSTGGESTAYGFGGTGNGGEGGAGGTAFGYNQSNQANQQSLGLSNSTTLNQTTVNPDEIKVRNTGDAVGYAAPPSAVCALTGGAGVAVPGFGGSVSGSSIDKGCEAREFARVLVNLGQPEAGIRVLCEANESVARNVAACADIAKANKERAASNKASDTRPTTDSMN